MCLWDCSIGSSPTIRFNRGSKMITKRRNSAISLAHKNMELMVAVPKVVTHRLMRMAAAGPQVSSRDRQEFQRMGSEKLWAFTSSWQAMAFRAFQINQTLMLSMIHSVWTPWWIGVKNTSRARQSHNALISILSHGIAPIHRTATANARRLASHR